MKLSSLADKIQPSATLSISAKAKALKDQGKDIVDFGVGEPDFVTPSHIRDAAIKAINDGFTKYPTPASGIAELKSAVIKKLDADNGLKYSAAEILVSCGAKHCLYNIVRVLVDKGDEVIIPAPFWVSYVEQVRASNGEPVIVQTDTSYKMTPQQFEKAMTLRTRLLIMNSPSNPTGAVYSEAELRALAEIAVKKNIWVISDEIYEKIIYDGLKHVSIASFNDEIKKHTVVVNGVSKSYAMTGWRIGYAAGPKDVIAAAGRLQDHVTSGPTGISQKASAFAMTSDQKCVADMVAEFDRRRRYIVPRCNEIFKTKQALPGGAFYFYPDVSIILGKKWNGKKISSTFDVTDFLLETAQAAVVPGEAFGTDRHVRFSYATSMENIKKGMDRIAEAVSKLE